MSAAVPKSALPFSSRAPSGEGDPAAGAAAAVSATVTLFSDEAPQPVRARAAARKKTGR